MIPIPSHSAQCSQLITSIVARGSRRGKVPPLRPSQDRRLHPATGGVSRLTPGYDDSDDYDEQIDAVVAKVGCLPTECIH